MRHKVRPGIEQAIERIPLRGKVPIISEVSQTAIMKMDLMPDNELIEFSRYPRYEIVISENVARIFEKESLRMVQKDPGDEVYPPNILR